VSTSDHRAAYQPGEELLRQAAGRLAQKQREREEAVERFVERNSSRYEERFGKEAERMCELTGRFEEIRELAPADLYEEVQERFEQGADVEELSEQVEMLEREGERRYENREVCNLGMAEIARDSGGVLENPQWKPGGELKAIFHFRDGDQMAAAMPERSTRDEGAWEIVWLGRTSNNRDCDAQGRSVRQVIESNDSLSPGGGPRPGSEAGGGEERAEGETAREAG